MGNLGKAIASVTIGGNIQEMGLPFLGYWYNVHDVPSSDAFEYFSKRVEGSSQNVEFISNPTSGGYMVIPTRKYGQVANYVDGISSSTSMASQRIIWKILTKSSDADGVSACVGSKYIEDLITNKTQEILKPSTSGGNSKYPDTYTGPRWDTPRGTKHVLPPDSSAKNTTNQNTQTNTQATADDFSAPFIAQEATCQDMWWSIETTSLSSSDQKNVPFFVDISMSSPLAKSQSTFFALRIGNIVSSSKKTDLSNSSDVSTMDVIDLVFVEGANGKLYDWSLMLKPPPDSPKGSENEPATVDLPGSITWGGSWNRIGFMPIAGRLLISINGQDFLYSRVRGSNAASADGSFQEGGVTLFYPSYNKIRAIGSNSQITMGLGQIVFAENASFPTPLSAGFNPKTGVASEPLQGSKNGVPFTDLNIDACSLVQLPNTQDDGNVLGAFARTSKEYQGDASESSSAVSTTTLSANDLWGESAQGKMFGEVSFALANDMNNGKTSGKNSQHYVVGLKSETTGFGEGKATNPKPNLAPVWFRARGVSSGQSPIPSQGESVDATPDVMEITESFSAPDRNHITHSMDIVLYNEDGKYTSLGERSVPIRVGMQWESGTINASSSFSNLFTGVVLTASKNLVAGKETISLHCEDYMFILESTLILNSPYYDGMDAYNVVRDLALKAGVDVQDDTGNGPMERFFVPSGYSFLEPVKRFDGRQSVKECILNIISTATKAVWFDGEGLMHYDHIQGGVAYTSAASADILTEYYSDPAETNDDKKIILDEKRTEVKLNSTVNDIYVKGVDRTTRALLRMNHHASEGTDRLSYRKIMFCNEPSLGSMDAVINFLESKKLIAYKPIRGITIKVADDLPLLPLNFIQVDGEAYRIMSINRSLRIEDNSITTSITGEWMGDQ